MKKLYLFLFIVTFFFSLSINNAQAVSVVIGADDLNVHYGGYTYISWTSTNAVSCIATGGSYGWSGEKSTSGSFYTGTLYQTTTFMITASNGDGSSTATEKITIIVMPYIHLENRVVGENTKVEIPIYLNGYVKKFQLDVDTYPFNGYVYFQPKHFYASDIFYYYLTDWVIDPNIDNDILKIAGLGYETEFSYTKIGTLLMYVYENYGEQNSGTIKTSFFDGDYKTNSYWNIKVLKLPKERYDDQNGDGKHNILDPENIWDSLYFNVSDTTQVLHDLDGNGERSTYDVRCSTHKLVNPYYEYPIFTYYDYYSGGTVQEIELTWEQMPNGKWGLFSKDTITNGDLTSKENALISGNGGLFKQKDNKISFINQKSTNSAILIADFPVELTGKVNEGRRIKTVVNSITNVEKIENIPTEFKLEQNYPNPFNPSTTISYSLPEAGTVTLKVYDILGKEVATLVNEEKSAGKYEVNFNASNLSSGMYIYKISAGNFVEVKKMILTK